ncbi:E3 ubiquitin-protein ligase MIEL1-like [Gossypium australe]|uniref:E3 ubiquitin-protein ligase MIEL1-like n=1 Tax=Gossypium australe TaxID=47621 RepID=A0A5B6WY73_9ROSI|nr:E3 ubiquitin-protein ligase MIEL1-like [Gossypium australe]
MGTRRAGRLLKRIQPIDMLHHEGVFVDSVGENELALFNIAYSQSDMMHHEGVFITSVMRQ